MGVFYFLHSILPAYETEGEGKRNCRTFILGMFLYCAYYIILKNLTMNNYLSTIMMDAFIYVGLIMFLADCAVMGYTYKSYFGRSIMNETLSDNDDEWEYNEETKKYKRKEHKLSI